MNQVTILDPGNLKIFIIKGCDCPPSRSAVSVYPRPLSDPITPKYILQQALQLACRAFELSKRVTAKPHNDGRKSAFTSYIHRLEKFTMVARRKDHTVRHLSIHIELRFNLFILLDAPPPSERDVWWIPRVVALSLLYETDRPIRTQMQLQCKQPCMS